VFILVILIVVVVRVVFIVVVVVLSFKPSTLRLWSIFFFLLRCPFANFYLNKVNIRYWWLARDGRSSKLYHILYTASLWSWNEQVTSIIRQHVRALHYRPRSGGIWAQRWLSLWDGSSNKKRLQPNNVIFIQISLQSYASVVASLKLNEATYARTHTRAHTRARIQWLRNRMLLSCSSSSGS